MRLFRNNDIIVAIADKDKAFKILTIVDGSEAATYCTTMRVATEEEANTLNEVYYHNDTEVTEEDHIRLTRLHELKEIRDWFTSTDYIPNKVIVGEWERTDERFVKYCEDRAAKRARQDELNALLGYTL